MKWGKEWIEDKSSGWGVKLKDRRQIYIILLTKHKNVRDNCLVGEARNLPHGFNRITSPFRYYTSIIISLVSHSLKKHSRKKKVGKILFKNPSNL